MALVVETGSGSNLSESYCSVAAFKSYHSLRGNAAAALMSDSEIEIALRLATDYMLQAYRSRWSGFRRLITQALDWPRYGIVVDRQTVVPYDSVPVEIINACAELALRSVSGTLYADSEQQVIREKIGPLEFEYDKNSPQSKRYKSIDAMLSPYLMGGGSGINMRLERV